MASTPSTHKRTATSPPPASAQSQPKISKYFEKKPQKDTPPAKKNPPSDITAGIPTKDKDLNQKAPASPPVGPQDSSSESRTLTLTYHTGDIFAAPPQTLLIHACNTQGSWGAGIAAAFRTHYPQAYKRYRAYCISSHNPSTNPVRTGTCLLIPPCETDPDRQKHWIGCLFTSAKYGKGKDKPNVILANTGPAMRELLEQFKEEGGDDKEVRMCKINSARFGVEWKRTVEVLEGIRVEDGWVGDVEVWSIE